MYNSTLTNVEFFLLGGYVLFSCSFNFFALLISSFYEKSLQKTSPKAGFIIAILLGIVFLILFFSNQKGPVVIQIISIISLLGSGVASIIGILGLFFTMNKRQ